MVQELQQEGPERAESHQGGAKKITESKLPSAEEMYEAQQGLYDYPAHDIFKILPLGRRKGTLHSNTTRVKNSFFPKAVLLAL